MSDSYREQASAKKPIVPFMFSLLWISHGVTRAAKAALVQPSRPARRRIEVSDTPNRAATAGADPKGGAKRHIPDR